MGVTSSQQVATGVDIRPARHSFYHQNFSSMLGTVPISLAALATWPPPRNGFHQLGRCGAHDGDDDNDDDDDAACDIERT